MARNIYHPAMGGANQGHEPTPEEIVANGERIRKLLAEMDAEENQYGPGLRCPKCGGQLVHERLSGYRCIRGCQR